MDLDSSVLAALEAIYEPSSLELQARRYQEAIETFRATYGPGPVAIYRCPGRVNLIGEHTDYNQGFCLPAPLDRDLLLLARPRADHRVVLHNAEPDAFPPRRFTLSAEIPSAPPGDWSNYARGAGQKLWREFGPLRGFDGLVVGHAPLGVPRGAGVSSSTALTVVTAIALADVNDIHPPPDQFALLCSEAEWYVGTRGGVLDQFATLLGRQGHALFLDCQPRVTPEGERRFHVSWVPLLPGYVWVLVDSQVRHRHVGGPFNVRVAEGRLGAACLARVYAGIKTLRDAQDLPWSDLEPLLPETTTVEALVGQGIAVADWLGDLTVAADAPLKIRSRCRHVYSENERVLASVEAWRSEDAHRVGELLNQAHVSLRDDYEVSCPEIEILRDLILACDGVLGARMVGGGWGGCVVALVNQGAEDELIERVLPTYEQKTQRRATAFVCQTSAGAGRVGPGWSST